MTELATLQIKVDANGAIRVVDQFGKTVEGATKKAQDLERAAGRVGKAVGGVLVAGLALAVKETIDAQREQAQLAAALRSTAGASGQTITSLNDHAAALRQLTAATGGEIAEAQAMLLTFTKIGGETFPQATMAVLDMAQALGTDARGAALQLGKALNDPMLGVTALGRAGVQFSASQKAMIASLVETNQLAAAQKIILTELETQVGGSAAAYRNTLGGALDAVRESFVELFEVTSPGMTTLVDHLNDLADTLGVLPTMIELTKEKFKNLFLQNAGGAGAVVDRLNGRASPTSDALNQSNANIAALQRLLDEQLVGVARGIEARKQGRTGRGVTPPGTDTPGVSEQADAFKAILDQHYRDSAEWLANRATDEENFREAVRQMEEQHYADSAELLKNRTDDEIAQDAAVAAVVAQHYKDSAEAVGFVEEGTDALTESARVFAEQSQLALARFASDFLKDGFKSVGKFWDSFTQLGRDAVGNIFAKSVMDGAGKMVGDSLKGAFDKVSGLFGGGALGALATGGIAIGVTSLLTGLFENGKAQREAAAAQQKAAEEFAFAVQEQKRDYEEEFLDFSGATTPADRQLRDITRARDTLFQKAFAQLQADAPNAANARGLFGTNFNEALERMRAEVEMYGDNVSGPWRVFFEQLEALGIAFERNVEAAADAEVAILAETRARQTLTLEAFKDSLALSGASPLSPVQQFKEAQRQYDAILALAQGGDASAVDSLPETARTLLDAARSVFASGSRYADVFGQVNADVTSVLEGLRRPLDRPVVAPDGSLITSTTGMIDPPDKFATVTAGLGTLGEALAGFAARIVTSTTDMLGGFETFTGDVRGAAETFDGASRTLGAEFSEVTTRFIISQERFTESVGTIITSTADMLRPPAGTESLEAYTGPWLELVEEQQASVAVQQEGFAAVVAAVGRVELAVTEMRSGIVRTLEETAS